MPGERPVRQRGTALREHRRWATDNTHGYQQLVVAAFACGPEKGLFRARGNLQSAAAMSEPDRPKPKSADGKAERLSPLDACVLVLVDRDPPWLSDLAMALLGTGNDWQEQQFWPLAQRLVVAGAIPEPDSAAFTAGMVGGLQIDDRPYRLAGQRGRISVEDRLRQAPMLLGHHLDHLFTAEPVAETLRSNWDDSWNRALADLADDDAVEALDRARLLDGVLLALTQDWANAQLARWYLDLWERLAPTVERALEALAGTSGSRDTLDATLTFRNGRIFYGIIPLGPAPRLILR